MHDEKVSLCTQSLRRICLEGICCERTVGAASQYRDNDETQVSLPTVPRSKELLLRRLEQMVKVRRASR